MRVFPHACGQLLELADEIGSQAQAINALRREASLEPIASVTMPDEPSVCEHQDCPLVALVARNKISASRFAQGCTHWGQTDETDIFGEGASVIGRLRRTGVPSWSRRLLRAVQRGDASRDPDGRYEDGDPDDTSRDTLGPELAVTLLAERFHDALRGRELPPGLLQRTLRVIHLSHLRSV
jgi:hypothetical protein